MVFSLDAARLLLPRLTIWAIARIMIRRCCELSALVIMLGGRAGRRMRPALRGWLIVVVESYQGGIVDTLVYGEFYFLCLLECGYRVSSALVLTMCLSSGSA